MLWSFVLLNFLYLSSESCRNEKYVSGNNTDQEAALQFLQEYNTLALEMGHKVSIANWNFETNLTDASKEEMLKMDQLQADFTKEAWKNATSFAWKEFKDCNKTAYRMFHKLSVLGTAALPEDKLKKLNTLVADMKDIYSKAKVCAYNATSGDPCELSLDPDLKTILSHSRNDSELEHIWSQWREVSGKKVKDEYVKYIKLSNDAAEANGGFNDAGELWREAYESDDFEKNVEELWQTLKPFYEQLHAYVRQKLRKQYPLSAIREDGPIPAHLLGNMWGQDWSNIYDLVKPYPNADSPNVTETMKAKNMKPYDMFKMSEEFFTSLGLIEMTPEFWNRSIIEKPTDTEMVCHASAWDFFDGKDFRIKMCTQVNLEELITVHHEMGHIEYYLQYAHQPAIFRNGANPGFHEAVGDVMALSAKTNTHLREVGLLEERDDDGDEEEEDINSLMETALSKIAFLPFSYLIDAWRWRVFDGSIKEEKLNEKWWEMRLNYQGVCPPVKRTNDDLDAAAKYHVVANIPYIRYFVSYVIQFQFHKALCDEAGHQGPLHKCDVYKNKEAGRLLSKVLSLGSSEEWETAMGVMTKGKTTKMDAGPLIDYFSPLIEWLKKENRDEFLGWKSLDPMICP